MVANPRTRLVNFRVSEDEFQNLKQACLFAGARSVSDFARSAVLGTFRPSGEPESVLKVKLSALDQKLEELEASVGELRGRLGRQDAGGLSAAVCAASL